MVRLESAQGALVTRPSFCFHCWYLASGQPVRYYVMRRLVVVDLGNHTRGTGCNFRS